MTATFIDVVVAEGSLRLQRLDGLVRAHQVIGLSKSGERVCAPFGGRITRVRHDPSSSTLVLTLSADPAIGSAALGRGSAVALAETLVELRRGADRLSALARDALVRLQAVTDEEVGGPRHA